MREIFLIARREYLAYVAAWGFWLSLATAPLLMALFILGPLMVGKAEPARPIAVIADNPADAEAIKAGFAAARRDASPPYIVVPAPARTVDALRPWLTGERPLEAADGHGKALFAAVFVHRSGEAVRLEYWSANLTDQSPSRLAQRALARRMRDAALETHGLSPDEVQRIGAIQPEVAQFDPRRGAGAARAVTDRERAPFIVGMLLSVLLWSSVIGVANMLLTGVIEEKSNKILDSLLTSATPAQILSGKLLGVAAVSFTLFAFWGVLTALGAPVIAKGQAGLGADIAAAALDPALLGLFVVFFLGGYLTFGAIFLGLGALCDTLQEAQSLLGPLVLLLTLPILLLGPAFQNPDAPLVETASWFPLFTPFVMMMRAPAGLSPLEIFGAVSLMTASVVASVWFSAQVFHAGVVNQVNAASWRRRLFRRDAASAQ